MGLFGKTPDHDPKDQVSKQNNSRLNLLWVKIYRKIYL